MLQRRSLDWLPKTQQAQGIVFYGDSFTREDSVLPVATLRFYHYHIRANIRRIVMSVDVKTKARPDRDEAEELCNVRCFKEDLVRKLQKRLPPEEALEDMRATFAALADRTRLKILHALKDGEELCVCDVAHVIGLSVSTASHHLRKLRDLKLLKYRNDGKMAYYSIRSEFAAQLVSATLQEISD